MLGLATLFSTLVFFSLTHAIDWQQNDWDAVWAMNCDFKGNDIAEIRTEGPECGKLCWNSKSCSHFTYYQGVCYLKQGRKSLNDASDLDGGVCGIIKPRGKFNIECSSKLREMNRGFSFNGFFEELERNAFGNGVDDFHYEGANVKASIVGFFHDSDLVHAFNHLRIALGQYEVIEDRERYNIQPFVSPFAPLFPNFQSKDRWQVKLLPVKFRIELYNSHKFKGSIQLDIGEPTPDKNDFDYCNGPYRKIVDSMVTVSTYFVEALSTVGELVVAFNELHCDSHIFN